MRLKRLAPQVQVLCLRRSRAGDSDDAARARQHSEAGAAAKIAAEDTRRELLAALSRRSEERRSDHGAGDCGTLQRAASATANACSAS
jgi:hypothetical protein